MATGSVRWFNPTKGYGYIAPDDGGRDVFVHISAVQMAGLVLLPQGDKISYEPKIGRSGKISAENLRLI
ncbi:cold-shock protein [Bradyrhizobium tunisiense]|uniref:cold-shock protein n=1 Tax=Bradyrhizobium tunisiense TaxID=3278709 RepID=UPI0035DDDF85